MPEQNNPTDIINILIPDFASNSIEQFAGINDVPIAPTNISGSNIPHLHDEHNKLINNITIGHYELRKAIQYNLNAVSNNSTLISNNSTAINTLNDFINNVNLAINTINSRLDSIEQQLIGDSAGDGTTSTFDYSFNLIYDAVEDESTALITTIELSGRLNQITLSNLPSPETDVSFLIGDSYLSILEIEPVNPSTFNFIISENIASDVQFDAELKIQIVGDYNNTSAINATVYITTQGNIR